MSKRWTFTEENMAKTKKLYQAEGQHSRSHLHVLSPTHTDSDVGKFMGLFERFSSSPSPDFFSAFLLAYFKISDEQLSNIKAKDIWDVLKKRTMSGASGGTQWIGHPIILLSRARHSDVLLESTLHFMLGSKFAQRHRASCGGILRQIIPVDESSANLETFIRQRLSSSLALPLVAVLLEWLGEELGYLSRKSFSSASKNTSGLQQQAIGVDTLLSRLRNAENPPRTEITHVSLDCLTERLDITLQSGEKITGIKIPTTRIALLAYLIHQSSRRKLAFEEIEHTAIEKWAHERLNRKGKPALLGTAEQTISQRISRDAYDINQKVYLATAIDLHPAPISYQLIRSVPVDCGEKISKVYLSCQQPAQINNFETAFPLKK